MSPSLFCSENSFLLMHMFQDFFKQFMLYGHTLIWTLHKCTGSQILFLIALKICLCYPFWNLIMNAQSLVLRNTRFKKYLLWLYFNLHWNITICITIVCSLTYAIMQSCCIVHASLYVLVFCSSLIHILGRNTLFELYLRLFDWLPQKLLDFNISKFFFALVHFGLVNIFDWVIQKNTIIIF